MSSDEPAKRALEARLLVDNPLYAAYKEDLEERRDQAVRALLKRGLSYERMTRLAGEVSALDYALGRPDELMKLDDPASLDPDPVGR